MFYAFKYADGRNTTTGNKNGCPTHIAGALLAFDTKKERDDYVAKPHLKRDRATYALVETVTTRSLPWGHTTKDAFAYDDDLGMFYPLHDAIGV